MFRERRCHCCVYCVAVIEANFTLCYYGASCEYVEGILTVQTVQNCQTRNDQLLVTAISKTGLPRYFHWVTLETVATKYFDVILHMFRDNWS